MAPTIEEIATAFSGGKFEGTYPFLADDIEWNIVGEKLLQGKKQVIEFCDHTAKYFASVTTDFKMSNLVVGDNGVAIDGTAEFTNAENKITKVSSCDVYRFEDGKLMAINSYCITTTKKE